MRDITSLSDFSYVLCTRGNFQIYCSCSITCNANYLQVNLINYYCEKIPSLKQRSKMTHKYFRFVMFLKSGNLEPPPPKSLILLHGIVEHGHKNLRCLIVDKKHSMFVK